MPAPNMVAWGRAPRRRGEPGTRRARRRAKWLDRDGHGTARREQRPVRVDSRSPHRVPVPDSTAPAGPGDQSRCRRARRRPGEPGRKSRCGARWWPWSNTLHLAHRAHDKSMPVRGSEKEAIVVPAKLGEERLVDERRDPYRSILVLGVVLARRDKGHRRPRRTHCSAPPVTLGVGTASTAWRSRAGSGCT